MNRHVNFFLWSVLALLGMFLATLSLGSVSIPIGEVARILTGAATDNAAWSTIVLQSRLPSAIMAVLAGSSLALCGLMMQTMFRNPVAGPFILGITSGSSLGVALLILLLHAGGGLIAGLSIGGQGLQVIAAGLGAASVFLLIMGIAYRVKDITVVLIIGLMIGSLTGALISIVQMFIDQPGLQAYVFWTFGSLRNITYPQVWLMTLIFVLGFAIVLFLIKPLNALLLGEEYARSLGVRIPALRMRIVVATCLLAGSVTAFCGPIAFVGLAVPHLCRMMLRTSNHRLLVPASVLVGGVLMGLCNLLATLPGSMYALPLNAVTSLIGAPFVIWVIWHRHSKTLAWS